MLSIYKPHAFTGFSKASWMCPTSCLTSAWLCMYLWVSVFLNLCTMRLLNLIWSRLWAWLTGIWDLDHKTQSVELAPCSPGSLGCWTGTLVPSGAGASSQPWDVEGAGPCSVWEQSLILCGVLIQETLAGKWHCPGWGSRKAPKSCFIPRNNFSFNEGDKWQIN